jgi:hypothetical protein
MLKQIVAVAFIFFCTAFAWIVLGTTVFSRTYDARSRLHGKVESTWGAAHVQKPPKASFVEVEPRRAEIAEGERKHPAASQTKRTRPLALEGSRVSVRLELEPRRKGLLWYSTYKVDYSGNYSFRNLTDSEQTVAFFLELPSTRTIYENLVIDVNGQPRPISNRDNAASVEAKVSAGKEAILRVSYRSHGLDTWSYDFGENVTQVRNFHLGMTTNFRDVDFPDGTVSPTGKRATKDGWDLSWDYRSLLSGFRIQVSMPELLQPGPLAGRISFFAPVSLFFFFFLMLIITTIRGLELHPMNYFFLAAAFFSFHLLLAYLVDHVTIHAALAISSGVSVFLMVSYLRLVTGIRFAALEAGGAQLIYLVLFSYAFLLNGLTGLTITIGSILTLFAVMQATGRVQWQAKFAAKPATIS